MDHALEKAEKARQISHFGEARKIYRKLLQTALSPEDKAEALLGLADVERIQGYFKEALLHYQKASRLLQKLDPTAVTDAQVGWALAARAVGKPIEALRELKKALDNYRKDKDPQGEAFVHWALGGTLRISGDMKRGLKELQTAFRMFKALKNAEGIAYTCCALGGILRMLGRYAESSKYYREANHRMRQRKDTFGIAYSYCGLGNVQRMAGRFKQALPFYKKAEKLYRTIGDRVSYAYTLWSIGTTYKMLGQYTQAHWAFYKADNLFKKTGDSRGRIYTLLGFAEIEFLKATFPQSPLPGGDHFRPGVHRGESPYESEKGAMGVSPHERQRRDEARVRGNTWWKQAKRIVGRSKFGWEKLHVEALKGGQVNLLASRYKQADSKFFPKSMPINWP